MTGPWLTDLSAFGLHLEKSGRHSDLVRLLKQIISLGSAQVDLKDAETRLSWIIANYKEFEPSASISEEHSVTMGAFFAHAVILYCRATETRPVPSARWKWWSASILNADQRVIHDKAMNLRDHGIAHFGLGEDAELGPMVDERAVVVWDGDRFQYAVVSNRAVHRIGFEGDFLSVVSHTLKIATARLSERYEDYDRSFRRAVTISPSLVTEWNSFTRAVQPDDGIFLDERFDGIISQTSSGVPASLKAKPLERP